MEVRRIPLGSLATNAYLLKDPATREVILIDAPQDIAPVLDEALQDESGSPFTLKGILLTHPHWDHVLGIEPLLGRAPLYAMRDALPIFERADLLWNYAPAPVSLASVPLNTLLRHGDTVEFDSVRIRVLEGSGHCPGSAVFYLPEQKLCFSGDTLFRESIGRTDLPGADHETLLNNIHNNLYTLPEETKVYPGHGPETTIGWEKTHNPFTVSS